MKSSCNQADSPSPELRCRTTLGARWPYQGGRERLGSLAQHQDSNQKSVSSLRQHQEAHWSQEICNFGSRQRVMKKLLTLPFFSWLDIGALQPSGPTGGGEARARTAWWHGDSQAQCSLDLWGILSVLLLARGGLVCACYEWWASFQMLCVHTVVLCNQAGCSFFSWIRWPKPLYWGKLWSPLHTHWPLMGTACRTNQLFLLLAIRKG